MQQHDNTERTIIWPGFGLLAGAGLGTVLGIFMDQVALGIAFGAGFGLVIGAVIDSLRSDRR